MSQLPHPRLAISSVLMGDYANGWIAHYGLKCSTFSTMNCGTSGRTPCTPCGNWEFPSVLEGNLLASRFLGTQLQNQTLFQYWYFGIWLCSVPGYGNMFPPKYNFYTWTTWEVTKGNIAPMPRGLPQRNDTCGAAIQFPVGILSPFSRLPSDAGGHRGFQHRALIKSLDQVAIGDHHVHNHHQWSFKKPWMHFSVAFFFTSGQTLTL